MSVNHTPITLKMSKNPEKTSNGMFRGVIYKYTNKDTQKPYVGKADNEKDRRKQWEKPGKSNAYAGEKIAEARKQYGVGPEAWDYTVLEEILADTHDELKRQLKGRETEWIHQEDAVENGYNSSYGDGMTGRKHTPESRKKISDNHRRYQSEATKEKISAAGKGRHLTEETKAKISAGNKGKKRTQAQNQAQSARMKGVVPTAATEGAKKWVKENGGSYWKNHPIPEEAKANMKAAQQARGTKVLATAPDGSTKEYPTMLDAAGGCGLNVGSVSSAVKTGGTTRNGYKFSRV